MMSVSTSRPRVENQAFRLEHRPIYATQFHPELDRGALLERVRAYPEYIERITGISYELFVARCRESNQSSSLLRRFVHHFFET